MVNFGGVCYFDPRPISEEDRARVTGLVGCGSPGVAVTRAGRLIMVEGSAGCRESDGAVTRLGAATETPVCHLDGRLDNRAALIARAGLPGGVSPDNAALVLAVFRAHGCEAFRDVIGDWSLALWDPSQGTLHLASDYSGIRPLYYHVSPECVIWSNSLGRLAAFVGKDKDLDADYVADFLNRGMAAECTPYSTILAVPPGKVIRIARGGVEALRFWSPPIGKAVKYGAENDYEEHFRVLFREACGRPASDECAGMR